MCSEPKDDDEIALCRVTEDDDKEAFPALMERPLGYVISLIRSSIKLVLDCS